MENLRRNREVARLRMEAERRDDLLSEAGLAYGISVLEVDADAQRATVRWPLHPALRLEVTPAAALLLDASEGAPVVTALPAEAAARAMEAVDITPAAPVDTVSAREGRGVEDAVARVPAAYSRAALGSRATVVSRKPTSALVEWRHVGGARTAMMVTSRGASFGPWHAERDGVRIAVQWEEDAPWARALVAAFGFGAPPETADETALFDSLVIEGDPRTRIGDAEFAFLQALCARIDRVLLLSPSVAVRVCDALRFMEASRRMEAVVADLFRLDGVQLWAPALDLGRVRSLRSNVKFLLWLVDQRAGPETARRLYAAYATATAERADPAFPGLLSAPVWTALAIIPGELRLTLKERADRKDFLATRPLELLAAEVWWTARETAAFVRLGGHYISMDGDAAVRDDVMPGITRPQDAYDDGLPAGTPPTAAALGRVYRTIILQAPMGTRKTLATLHYLRRFLRLTDASLDRPTPRRILQISPRRSFGSFVVGALGAADLAFKHYSAETGDLGRWPRLVIQAESLHRIASSMTGLPARPPHVVILDEVAMLLMQLCSPETHRDNHRLNLEVFVWAVRHARVVLLADAFMTPAVLNLLRYLRGGVAHDPAVMADRLPGCYFLDLPARPELGPAVELASYKELTHSLAQTLVGGVVSEGEFLTNRVVCCIASAHKAQLLAEWIGTFNLPGHKVHTARRRAVRHAAAEHGFDAAWEEAQFKPLRVKLYIGGRREEDEDLLNVNESWRRDRVDVVIHTTTISCGVSCTLRGRDAFFKRFLYACAGSDVCRVQAQMCLRVRHVTQPGITFCVEARGPRPAARGIAECRWSIDQRALLVRGLVETPDAAMLPPFARELFAERDNERAICCYGFAELMRRYLELAGFEADAEAQVEVREPEAPPSARALPRLSEVPPPELEAGTSEAQALAGLRFCRQGGFKLTYREQLWVTSHDFRDAFLSGTEPPEEWEMEAMWPFAVDAMSGGFSKPFAFLLARRADRDGRREIAAWVRTRFVETVPAHATLAWGVAGFEHLSAEAGVPGRAATMEVPHVALERLAGLIRERSGCEHRLAVLLELPARHEERTFGAQRLITMFRRVWEATLGARVRVVQEGQVRVPTTDLLAHPSGVMRVHRRSLAVDWRPYWRIWLQLFRDEDDVAVAPALDWRAWWAETADEWGADVPAEREAAVTQTQASALEGVFLDSQMT